MSLFNALLLLAHLTEKMARLLRLTNTGRRKRGSTKITSGKLMQRIDGCSTKEV